MGEEFGCLRRKWGRCFELKLVDFRENTLRLRCWVHILILGVRRKCISQFNRELLKVERLENQRSTYDCMRLFALFVSFPLLNCKVFNN